ncbi:MAG: hypothetical protein KY455_09655 [Euryarchaeota archaeon]|nr:hypothetical protein [Euryarchaeota archaeon]
MASLEDGPEETEYKEVTLADIVKVLHRRKLVLGTVFLVVLLAGVGVTALTTPMYESKASIIPLAHQDIIKNWLDSRNAAELVTDDLGEPLVRALFPDRWDAERRAWDGNEPSREDAGRALKESVTVAARTTGVRGETERYLEVTVTLSDPLLARDVAAAYIESLQVLRPNLENITRQDAFDRYYDGSNEQEAQNRAEVTAKQMDYWLMLDRASTPQDPVSPNVTLNIALAVVLGLVLGVFTVFFTEWLSNYRAQNRSLDLPEGRAKKVSVAEGDDPVSGQAKRKYG